MYLITTNLFVFTISFRCYYDRVEGILESFADDPPDIVVMNSCLWDISRLESSSLFESPYPILSATAIAARRTS